MLSKVECAYEREHMRFETLEVRVMECLDRRFLDGTVHAFGLPVCPGVVGLGEPVLNGVFVADPAKDVHSQPRMDRLVSILGQVCEGHTVVGEDGVDAVREGLDHTAQELRAIHLADIVPELYVGELGDSIDGQEHVHFALSQTHLGAVDMHVANRARSKLSPSVSVDLA